MNLIAETAWHHDGDFVFLKELVLSILSKTEADYIKFHVTLDYDEYVHTDHPGYEWIKDRIFTKGQWAEIFNLVLKANKKLMLLFNDTEAIEFGMKFNPELVEIHSVCLNDNVLLEKLNSQTTQLTNIILGVGGCSLYEIENAINLFDTNKIVLMHGFQNYPTKYEDINFSKIRRLIQLYPQYDHGYADHTAWDNENNVLITLMGAALGMDYIEKHLTTVTGEGRTDWQAAISFEKFIEIQDKLNILSIANGNGLLELNEGERSYSTFGTMKKAAILNKDIPADNPIEINDFTFKRTGQNSDLSQLEVLLRVGQKSSKDLKKGHCLLIADFE